MTSFIKNSKIPLAIVTVAIVFSIFLVRRTMDEAGLVDSIPPSLVEENLAARFEYLRSHGNSSCSSSFMNVVGAMNADDKIMGSCCSPMSMHRYQEQVGGLKKYSHISKVPADPYAVNAGLAKELRSYYDLELSTEEQVAYDYAMEHSHEKGPCCCKCWHWFVYGGLGKYLIRERKFTGEQVTEVWNLSDGCGGDEEHHHT